MGNKDWYNLTPQTRYLLWGSLAHADKCYKYYCFLGAFAHSEVEQPFFGPASWLAQTPVG